MGELEAKDGWHFQTVQYTLIPSVIVPFHPLAAGRPGHERQGRKLVAATVASLVRRGGRLGAHRERNPFNSNNTTTTR